MDYYIWWAVAGMGLIIIELVTGTRQLRFDCHARVPGRPAV